MERFFSRKRNKELTKGSWFRLRYAIKYVWYQALLAGLERLYRLRLLERPKPLYNCYLTGTPIENGLGVDFRKLSGMIKQSGMTTQQFLTKFGSAGKIDMRDVRPQGLIKDPDKQIKATVIESTLERVIYINGERYNRDTIKPEELTRIKKGLSKLEQEHLDKLFFPKGGKS